MGIIILVAAFLVLVVLNITMYLLWYHRPSRYVELFFSFNSITFKIKGGKMTNEMSPRQKFEFDLQFKNKNGNPARVDGNVSLNYRDPNTGEVLTTTAQITSEPVEPDENGNSSKHHVVVQTSADEISAIQTGQLVATADVDLVNDKDDSTDEDVKATDFRLLTTVFKPLAAVEAGVENLTLVEDIPAE